MLGVSGGGGGAERGEDKRVKGSVSVVGESVYAHTHACRCRCRLPPPPPRMTCRVGHCLSTPHVASTRHTIPDSRNDPDM